MKFTKLIKVLLPIATVSGVAPFVANCGCGNNTYVINYGDNVDCINEKAKNYHKLDDVRKAIVNKADREIASQVNLTTITTRAQTTEIGIQNFYYDIIASLTVVNKQTMQLTDWKATKNAEGKYVITGKINYGDGIKEITSLIGSYGNENNEVVLKLGTKYVKSYTYQNCLPE